MNGKKLLEWSCATAMLCLVAAIVCLVVATAMEDAPPHGPPLQAVRIMESAGSTSGDEAMLDEMYRRGYRLVGMAGATYALELEK